MTETVVQHPFFHHTHKITPGTRDVGSSWARDLTQPRIFTLSVEPALFSNADFSCNPASDYIMYVPFRKELALVGSRSLGLSSPSSDWDFMAPSSYSHAMDAFNRFPRDVVAKASLCIVPDPIFLAIVCCYDVAMETSSNLSPVETRHVAALARKLVNDYLSCVDSWTSGHDTEAILSRYRAKYLDRGIPFTLLLADAFTLFSAAVNPRSAFRSHSVSWTAV